MYDIIIPLAIIASAFGLLIAARGISPSRAVHVRAVRREAAHRGVAGVEGGESHGDRTSRGVATPALQPRAFTSAIFSGVIQRHQMTIAIYTLILTALVAVKGPRTPSNIVVAMGVGLILGVALAFVQEALDNRVRTVEEVERIVKAPALTVNPVDHATARAGPQEAGLVVLKRPSSALAESFRHLRASVLLSTAPSQPARTLLVTSARIEEGRTSTATNLAISFAQGGGAVLIVDADLRRPAVAGTFGVSNERGLSSVLTGVLTLEEVLVRNDRIPNLWVLPAGPRPADPADLLSSHMMEATIKDLAKRFTQIVIDSPPLLVETDAVALSPKVEGVILVVASGTTARGDLRRAHRILESAGARLLGTVLNNVDMRFDDYNGSYYGPYHQLYHDPTSVPGPSRWPEADGPQAKVPPRKP